MPAYTLSNYTFTGQYSYMDDPSTAGVTEGFVLLFYNARFYDPAVGRFISADSIVPGGVQGYDRYAYVNNNPVRYTDPSGHMFDEGCTLGCGGSGSSGTGNDDDIPTPDDNDDDDDDGGGDECPNLTVCVPGVSSDVMHNLWDYNNELLDSYDTWTTYTGIGALLSMVGTAIIYITTNGQPIYTYSLIAMVTGISVIEPTNIGKFLIGTTAVLGVTAFALDQTAKNIQSINDAIVKSGAYENGGTITANLTGVTITTTTGTTPIPSLLVGNLLVNSWAGGNPNLVPGH